MKISEALRQANYKIIMDLAKGTDGLYNPGAIKVIYEVYKTGEWKLLDVIQENLKHDEIWEVYKDGIGEGQGTEEERLQKFIAKLREMGNAKN